MQRMVWGAATGTCVLLLQLGCSRAVDHASAPAPLQFSGFVAPGVRQVVTLHPGAPAHGDTVLIRTVLRNVSADSVVLDVTDDPMADGTLAIRIPPDRIFLRSGGRRVIAPQDSLVNAFRGIIDSPPGTYVLHVRHASGGAQVTGSVTVRARTRSRVRGAAG